MVVPEWEADARPRKSARPFELYVDASDEAWCVVLCQRKEPAGPLHIIALVAKDFEDAATR